MAGTAELQAQMPMPGGGMSDLGGDESKPLPDISQNPPTLNEAWARLRIFRAKAMVAFGKCMMAKDDLAIKTLMAYATKLSCEVQLASLNAMAGMPCSSYFGYVNPQQVASLQTKIAALNNAIDAVIAGEPALRARYEALDTQLDDTLAVRVDPDNYVPGYIMRAAGFMGVRAEGDSLATAYQNLIKGLLDAMAL